MSKLPLSGKKNAPSLILHTVMKENLKLHWEVWWQTFFLRRKTDGTSGNILKHVLGEQVCLCFICRSASYIIQWLKCWIIFVSKKFRFSSTYVRRYVAWLSGSLLTRFSKVELWYNCNGCLRGVNPGTFDAWNEARKKGILQDPNV